MPCRAVPYVLAYFGLARSVTGLFSWIPAVARINDEDTLRLVGMDHYVLIRFMLFGMKLTGL